MSMPSSCQFLSQQEFIKDYFIVLYMKIYILITCLYQTYKKKSTFPIIKLSLTKLHSSDTQVAVSLHLHLLGGNTNAVGWYFLSNVRVMQTWCICLAEIWSYSDLEDLLRWLTDPVCVQITVCAVYIYTCFDVMHITCWCKG